MRELTIKDRYYIEVELKNHTSVTKIAEHLGYNRSTIYKEIKLGQCEQIIQGWSGKTALVYLSDVAQRKHEENIAKRGVKKKLSSSDVWLQEIKRKIVNEKYSPEAAIHTVAGRKCCTSTIYNYIHAGYLDGVTIQQLPYCKKKKKKKKEEEKGKRPPRGRSIEERPKDINLRKEYGHWEMDTVYSSHDDKTCLLVLTERKTREEILFQIPNRTASSVVKCLNRLERKLGVKAFREKFKTITCDNGVEFSDWQGIERSIRNKTPRTTTYFCHPYTSCERASNENQNKMVRRWIPKGDDIGLYTPQEVEQIQDWINNYPRKLFGWKSTNDMLAV